MHNDNTDRDTLQADARKAALGPISGPCCTPHETPCIACVPPDDVPYEPSPEDEEWYRGLCRERDARLWEERMAADEEQARADLRRDEADARLAAAVYAAAKAPTFQQLLADLCNAFRDHEGENLAWVGSKLGDLFDRARYLEATSGEQYSDREDAMLDAVLAAHSSR